MMTLRSNPPQVEVYQSEDTIIFEVIADHVATDAIPSIAQRLHECLHDGSSTTLMVQVRAGKVDSAFLGMLISIHNEAQGRGKTLEVGCTKTSQLREVLAITRLDNILNIFELEELTPVD